LFCLIVFLTKNRGPSGLLSFCSVSGASAARHGRQFPLRRQNNRFAQSDAAFLLSIRIAASG
ncbi:hypothetical protein, partial [Clostridium sp. D33t1_170424_F3]|uniref:hypothetical protein n=1 Tax=Clostridium sp. D33t1_170424_F3 TaxID=2787099 RepID=UPI001A9A7DFC